MSEKKSFSLRINRDIWEKFKYISYREYRSSNGQLVYIIQKNIAEFEKEHGVIDTKNKLFPAAVEEAVGSNGGISSPLVVLRGFQSGVNNLLCKL